MATSSYLTSFKELPQLRPHKTGTHNQARSGVSFMPQSRIRLGVVVVVVAAVAVAVAVAALGSCIYGEIMSLHVWHCKSQRSRRNKPGS